MALLLKQNEAFSDGEDHLPANLSKSRIFTSMRLKSKIPTATKNKSFIVGQLRLPITQRIFRLGLISILLVLNILGIDVLKFQPVQAERCNWADITCIPYIKERSSSIAEEAWGAAGTVAYQAAAEWMRANNGIGQYLDETQKQGKRILISPVD